MPILILLGLIIIGASIALVYTQKNADDKEKNFISKILSTLSGFGGNPPGEKPASKASNYEKSADGKVVYIYKNREEDAESESKESSDTEDTEAKEADAEVVDDATKDSDEK